MRFKIVTDPQEWGSYAERVLNPSVYLSYGWVAAAALLEEGGTPELAVLEHGGRFVAHPYVRRTIGETGYYDLISAFDFGGIWANDERWIQEWGGPFRDFCAGQNILSEFTRYYPFSGILTLDAEFVRFNVIVDLNKSQDTIWAEAADNAKGPAKQGQKYGLQAQECPIEDFMALYHQNVMAMDRNPYYLFPMAWAERIAPMVECWGAYLEGELQAAHLYVKDGKRLFYFLSCSDLRRREYRPNDFLFWETIQRAKAQGYEVFHLGGGETESLVKFKAKWSPDRVPYYVGKAVFMPDVYGELSQGRETGFFPAYRGKG